MMMKVPWTGMTLKKSTCHHSQTQTIQKKQNPPKKINKYFSHPNQNPWTSKTMIGFNKIPPVSSNKRAREGKHGRHKQEVDPPSRIMETQRLWISVETITWPKPPLKANEVSIAKSKRIKSMRWMWRKEKLITAAIVKKCLNFLNFSEGSQI